MNLILYDLQNKILQNILVLELQLISELSTELSGQFETEYIPRQMCEEIVYIHFHTCKYDMG